MENIPCYSLSPCYNIHTDTSKNITINQWLQKVHLGQKERFTKIQPPLLNKRLYKCKWGSSCFQGQCQYVHPTQKYYNYATYYTNPVLCRYETANTTCRQKCVNTNGRYCPFQHCTHGSHEVTMCSREACVGHCPKCI